MPQPPGTFIVFEGGDGAGKSTQIGLLRARFAGTDHEVVVTREPGGTAFGQTLRDLVLHGDHVAPRAEALLFAADRAHHVETLVRPAVGRGAVVIADRYQDSSVAYQGAGRDLDAAEVAELSWWATDGLLPDLTVLLDLDPVLGSARRARRAGVGDRLEQEGGGFHERVRAHFLALAAADPGRYLVLDATLRPEDLAERVWRRVQDLPGMTAG